MATALTLLALVLTLVVPVVSSHFVDTSAVSFLYTVFFPFLTRPFVSITSHRIASIDHSLLYRSKMSRIWSSVAAGYGLPN